MSTKYEHSIKVPRLYKTAAKIAQKVKEDGSSLKQLVYEKKHPNIKALYALVVQTLQNDDNLNSIIRHTQILTKENRLDPWLARVLITELLWGKKKLPGDSKPIQTVLSYQDKYLEDFTPQKKNKPKTKKVIKPKYVRVNTLKVSVLEVIENFQYEGWSLIRCGDGSDYAAFLATSASLSEDQFMVDILVKDLLLFPPGSQFYEHKYYKNGNIMLQDKASCLAPLLLNPPAGSTVLDMCSAPGMKCIQLASLVELSGKVFAVERDQRRFEVLNKLLASAEATNVKSINKDVLTLTDADLKNVEYILVDPSCSGSGMLDRMEFEDEDSKCNESRLQKLAGFQITILRHALNNFKSAKRIVYSTCSIYSQENEEVVQQAITTTPDFKLVPLNEQLKDKWYNFGAKEFGKIGESCLYARPELDRTNGFFIALFERLEEGETNEHFVKRVHRSSECENIEDNNIEIDENDQTNGETNSNKKRKKQKNKHSEESETKEEMPKKRKNENDEIEDGYESMENEETQKVKKHKKKKVDKEIKENIDDNEDMTKEKKKKKKKDKKVHEEIDENIEIEDVKKEKKEKKKKKENKVEEFNVENDEIAVKPKKKKKKDKTNNEDDIEDKDSNKSVMEIKNEVSGEKQIKKKKKHKHVE